MLPHARKEIAATLDPTLISFLKKRGQKRMEQLQQKKQEQESKPLPTTVQELLQKQAAASSTTFSSSAASSLAHVPVERDKLEWMREVTEEGLCTLL